MKTPLQTLLEQIDKDPVLSSVSSKPDHQQKMQEAVDAAVHIIQGFAHEVAGKLADGSGPDPEESYIQLITEFVDKVKEGLMDSQLSRPKNIDVKLIAKEFGKLFHDKSSFNE